MIILREIILPTQEQEKLYKHYCRGVITLFEMVYKLVDIIAGPSPNNEKLLVAYDTAVHLADIWTSPINVFLNSQVSARSFQRRFPDLNIAVSETLEQHSDPRINNKVRAVVWTPNYEVLAMLHKHASIAKG